MNMTANTPSTIVTTPQVIANDESSAVAHALPAESAWQHFFSENFSSEKVLPSLDLMVDTLDSYVPSIGGSPISLIAKNATGEQMALGTRIFGLAVAKRSMSAFKKGSLAKMALAEGNDQGALDAAIEDPRIASVMRDENGVTLLLEAMISGNLGMIHELTKKRQGASLVDPYRIDSRDNTALINYLRLTDVIRIDVLDAFSNGLLNSRSLLSEEALTYMRLISHSNSFGKNAAHIVAYRLSGRMGNNTEANLVDAFKWLSARMDINTPDAQDRTALMDVCKLGNTHVLNEMVHLGADISWISGKGVSALSSAVYHNNHHVVHELFKIDEEKVVQSIDAMTEERIGENLSIPLLAARLGCWESLYAYLEHCKKGMDASSSQKDNHTALIYAVKANDDKAVDLLINNGCAINQKNDHGMTAMHYVAHHFDNKPGVSSKIFYALLDGGASLEEADLSGQTPLDIVLNNGKFTTSNDFFYMINVSQIANWCFSGDQVITKKYVDSSPYAVMACSGIINKLHPLVGNAPLWAEEHTKSTMETNKKDIKQGYHELKNIIFSTSALGYGMMHAIEKADHPKLNQIMALLPSDYHLPAIGLTAFVAALISSTNGGSDFSQVKNIGLAAKHFARMIDNKLLMPMTSSFKKAKGHDKHLIGRVYKLCSAVKDYCIKIQAACGAFKRVLQQKNHSPRTAVEMIGQMDDKQVLDIAKLSRQEFSKIQAEARLKVRENTETTTP
ncbi:ankyrin repeat domain-containing protein (plasmid) [Pseudomonas sp. FeN3W]|nr:ankyrin repeat domain-containing protein [Pseudomonas sp. FeN3W]